MLTSFRSFPKKHPRYFRDIPTCEQLKTRYRSLVTHTTTEKKKNNKPNRNRNRSPPSSRPRTPSTKRWKMKKHQNRPHGLLPASVEISRKKLAIALGLCTHAPRFAVAMQKKKMRRACPSETAPTQQSTLCCFVVDDAEKKRESPMRPCLFQRSADRDRGMFGLIEGCQRGCVFFSLKNLYFCSPFFVCINS